MRVTRATSPAAGCIIGFTRATLARKEDIMAAEHAGRTAVDPEITIAPNPRRVVVKLGGRVIADSRRVLVMRARDAAPSLYIPPEDVAMSALTLTSHHTRCPYKGDASYWTIRSGDRERERSVVIRDALREHGADQGLPLLLSGSGRQHRGASRLSLVTVSV